MPGDIIMINDQGDERSKLNNSEPQINRGVELLLRNRRKRESKPKTFQVKFGKMISLFRREFHFFIEFHFDIRKKKTLWRTKNGNSIRSNICNNVHLALFYGRRYNRLVNV